MASTTQFLTVRFHCFLDARDPLREEITARVRQAEVDCDAPISPVVMCPGIVVLDEVSAEVCQSVRELSRNGTGRVLVLACDERALEKGGVWRVLQAGASDVLLWDDLPDPAAVIAARLQRWRMVDALVESPPVKNNLVGESRVWKSVLRRIVEVATFTDSAILLMGETGTGKELAARLVHTLDPQRREHDLVILDCTTVVPDLSGSELFGHERGAFTGAVKAREGAFASADHGTLFLDEVGELPLELQVQLLRVLQEKTYKRIGSDVWRTTDFRLVCATNRDLLSEVEHGRFRRDLYYRIASWTIKLPPLRERIQDVILLVKHFMKQAHPGVESPELDSRVSEYFLTRAFPGNVRDLRNLVFRIMSRHVGPGPITVGDIPSDERPSIGTDAGSGCGKNLEQVIRRALESGVGWKELNRTIKETAFRIAVDDEDGSLQRAAQKLDVTDRTLQMWRAEEQQRIQALMSDVNGRT